MLATSAFFSVCRIRTRFALQQSLEIPVDQIAFADRNTSHIIQWLSWATNLHASG